MVLVHVLNLSLIGMCEEKVRGILNVSSFVLKQRSSFEYAMFSRYTTQVFVHGAPDL